MRMRLKFEPAVAHRSPCLSIGAPVDGAVYKTEHKKEEEEDEEN